MFFILFESPNFHLQILILVHFISFYPAIIPIQHSPPAWQTRSQGRTQAVLTPTPRAPLDGTPAVSQLRAKLDRGPILEGAAPSRKEGRGPRRSSSFSGVVGGLPGTSRTIFRGPGEDGEGRRKSLMSEPSLLAIMQQMTQIMANLQAASSSEASRLHLARHQNSLIGCNP
ncbi:hypothetical protein O181_009763 [Austropuccinia psidii MF-1]|uniref:Uncharacterized protein n=1 Tax=Austropuccinia psidii MF-1 TaxID=1389203 RepID=A0A9Q3GJR0_9BASI|nr:hypothetical protein [Austropuccinia psidii MF-1]